MSEGLTSLDSPLVGLHTLHEQKPRVLIIGSGPSGVAVAEHLYNECPEATIGIVERGGLLITTHVSNMPLPPSAPLYLSGGGSS